MFLSSTSILRNPVPALIAALTLIHTPMHAQDPKLGGDPLDARQQSIATIASLTATGDQLALRAAIHTGLDGGLAINDAKEVIVQLYAYTGFPRSLNALTALMAVVDERKQTGKNDTLGREPDPMPTNGTRLELGTELQTRLVGRPVSGDLYTFAPVIDQFLKEHLFCDIFGRNNLDFKTREIATIAALASLSGVDAQLRSHMNIGLHNGVSHAQLAGIVAIVAKQVDAAKGRAAQTVLHDVLGTPLPGGPVDLGPVAFALGELFDNGNFTGAVWVNMLAAGDNGNDTNTGHVTFSPRARTNWHTHPGGQILLVTSGTGYVQERGGPKRILRAGESLTCPPGVEHWHGAGPDGTFSHIAITTEASKGPVVWKEPVSDEQYGD